MHTPSRLESVVWRPLAVALTASVATAALSGCTTESKPDFAAFCVATAPSNVDAVTIQQTIQNTTLRLGVSKRSYKNNFTFRPIHIIGPDVKNEDGTTTHDDFEGTAVDSIKLKLASDRHTDAKTWRNVPLLTSDELVFCYKMFNSTDYNEGGEIVAYQPPTDPSPAFDTSARNNNNDGPSNFKKLVGKYPKGVFILNPALTAVEKTA